MDTTITTLKGETGRDARRRIRAGTNLAPTSGMAPGYVQGNLAILPKALALCAALVLLGPFMLATLSGYTHTLLDRMIAIGGS